MMRVKTVLTIDVLLLTSDVNKAYRNPKKTVGTNPNIRSHTLTYVHIRSHTLTYAHIRYQTLRKPYSKPYANIRVRERELLTYANKRSTNVHIRSRTFTNPTESLKNR